MDKGIMELIQQTNCNGFKLKDCMPELQVLMTHLDNLIAEKQTAWQFELQSARNELDLRNAQLNEANAKLDQKQVETKSLTGKVESKTKIINQYDVELTNLKTKLKSLQQNHQNLNDRRAQKQKQKNFCNREKEFQTEIDELKLELGQKRVLIATHQKESSEWEINKKSLQKQIECMERQKEAILNNYENCRHILSEVRNELKQTKDVKDQIDNNSRTMIQKLEEELINNKKLIQKQDILNASLQKRFRELDCERHQAHSDKLRYREESDITGNRAAILEEENKRLSEYLSIKENSLKISDAKVGDLKSNIQLLQEQLNTKQAAIVESEEKARTAAERMKFEKRICELEENLVSMKTSEASMKDQVQFLERQLNKSNECMAVRYFSSFEPGKQMDTLTDELKTLQKKLRNMEKSHTRQLESVKFEINKLMQAWRKGCAGDTENITKTCAEMEKRLGDEASRRRRLNKELEDATRNLQIHKDGSDIREVDSSLHEVERSLLELKRGYEKADSNLKKKNSNLKDKVTTLRKIGMGMDTSPQQREQQRLSINFANVDTSTPRSSMDSTTLHNNSCDEDITTRHLRTPTPTREFLRSLGFYPSSSEESCGITPTTSEHNRRSWNRAAESDSRAMIGMDTSTGQNSTTNHPATEAKSHFLRSYVADDMERTSEMQKRIESHIDDVERAMTNVMEKYFDK